MRIGVFGGSFNPIHCGHIDIAVQIRRRFGLDRLLLMVANDPPHKALEGNLTAAERYYMACIGAEGVEGVEVSGLELRRPGKSYTVDTMRELRREHPESELYLIVGADMLITMDTWHRAGELLGENRIIAAGRPEGGDIAAAAERLRKEYGADIRLAGVTGPDISSTMIRGAVERGGNISGLLPERVAQRIYLRGHYLPAGVDAIRARLEAELDEKRYLHTLGVARMAAELAERYGVDAQRARLGALLHDCAKLSRERQYAMAAEYGMDTEGIPPSILHGPLGALRAKRVYGIDDEAVLHSIDVHTVGATGMSGLDKVVYLADKIEYGRNYPSVEELRQESFVSLDRGMAACMKRGMEKLAQKGVEPSGSTLRALKEIEQRLIGQEES